MVIVNSNESKNNILLGSYFAKKISISNIRRKSAGETGTFKFGMKRKFVLEFLHVISKGPSIVQLDYVLFVEAHVYPLHIFQLIMNNQAPQDQRNRNHELKNH